MRNIVKIIAVLFFLLGLLWFLQGINILPGSYMSGNSQWTINGAITMVISGAVFWLASRKR